MTVKIFTLNGNGKIEMTEAELQKLLDDRYWAGYSNGRNSTKGSAYLTNKQRRQRREIIDRINAIRKEKSDEQRRSNSEGY